MYKTFETFHTFIHIHLKANLSSLIDPLNVRLERSYQLTNTISEFQNTYNYSKLAHSVLLMCLYEYSITITTAQANLLHIRTIS